MKKILTVVLIVIIAVVAAGYVAVTFRKTPEIIDGNPTGTEIISEDVTETTKQNIIDSIFGKDETTTEAPTTEPVTREKIEDYAYAYAGFMPYYADMEVEDWRLILVNRDYILPDGYKPQLENSITDDPNSAKLDYRVAPYYNEMYLAAKADGVDLVPISGYRSVERQKNNFERKFRHTWIRDTIRLKRQRKPQRLFFLPEQASIMRDLPWISAVCMKVLRIQKNLSG